MKYNPALDGLRAIACLMVLFHHCSVPGFSAGNLGVEVFFVLSGYLITSVMAATEPTLIEFYIRRFRRLMPALALLVLVYAIAATALQIPHVARDSAATLLYVVDVTKLLWDWPEYLGHAWSLGIEEKFYLLWPLIFLRWRPSVRVLLLGFVLFTAWRFASYGTDEARLRFDLHLSGLVLGCAIAGMQKRTFPAWPALLVIGALVYTMDPNPPTLRLYGVGAVELATGALLLGSAPRWLGWKPLAYIGKLSYGIYLWHYPITLLLAERGLSWQVNAAITFTASVAFAALSFHTVEAYFRHSTAGRRDQVGPEQGMKRGNVGAAHGAIGDVGAGAATLPR